MSLEDWQHGLQTGLQQSFYPAVRRRNESWLLACKRIIDHTVAPEMRPMALELLHQAMLAAERDMKNDADIPKTRKDIPKLASASWNVLKIWRSGRDSNPRPPA